VRGGITEVSRCPSEGACENELPAAELVPATSSGRGAFGAGTGRPEASVYVHSFDAK